MKTLTWLAAAVTLTVALGTATAHPHAYVLGNDFVSITELEDSDGVPDVGGVRFAAGEVVADIDTGIATVDITESLGQAGGLYCQDVDDDSICGESEDPVLGQVAEPFLFFCNSSGTAIVSGVNYSPLLEVLVFIDGPVFGSPVFSTCGTVLDGNPQVSWGASGSVDHSV